MTQQPGDRTNEAERIRRVYEQYEANGRFDRWSKLLPGNRAMVRERERALGELLREVLGEVRSPIDAARQPVRILDVGCGDGDVLRSLPSLGIGPLDLYGVDVSTSEFALGAPGPSNAAGAQRTSHTQGPEPRLLVASGDALPFADSSFRVVLTLTLFSSVLDARTRLALIAEIARVIEPGGVLVVYDMRYPSPTNRNVRPLTLRTIDGLFPLWDTLATRTCTLIPQVSRHLGRRTDAVYDRLAAVRLLRSHRLTALRAPGPTIRARLPGPAEPGSIDVPAPAQAPAISVLLPAHQRIQADELTRAVTSILGQTFDDLEIVLGLDGVAPGELHDTATALAAADPRVRVVELTKQSSIGAVLNHLIAEARGELLARMDADDVSLPHRFARQVEFLASHPDVVAVGTFAEEVDLAGSTTFVKTLPTTPADLRRFLARRDPLIHPTVMFRADVFDLVGGYSSRPAIHYLEDTELWTRLALADLSMANIPEVLFRFTVTDDLYEQRRRGHRLIIEEARLRLGYLRRSGLPLHLAVYPLSVAVIRSMPGPVVRHAYHRLR